MTPERKAQIRNAMAQGWAPFGVAPGEVLELYDEVDVLTADLARSRVLFETEKAAHTETLKQCEAARIELDAARAKLAEVEQYRELYEITSDGFFKRAAKAEAERDAAKADLDATRNCLRIVQVARDEHDKTCASPPMTISFQAGAEPSEADIANARTWLGDHGFAEATHFPEAVAAYAAHVTAEMRREREDAVLELPPDLHDEVTDGSMTLHEAIAALVCELAALKSEAGEGGA